MKSPAFHFVHQAKGMAFSFLFLCSLCVGVSSGALVITEVMTGSAHPSTDQVTGFGGLANGDWWELVNTGPNAVDMTGYLWDDNQRLSGYNSNPALGTGYTIFPNNFVIQPGELILVVEEDQFAIDAVGGWRESWDLAPQVRVLARDTMQGPDTFSGLSSTNGDEVNLYSPDRTLVASVGTPVLGSIRGYSFEWDDAATSLAESINGENFAYVALLDGSETPGPYSRLDVASPGLFVAVGGGNDGDFNDDGNFNCGDVNSLVAAIAGGTNPPNFDLTSDGQVNDADLTAWLAEAGDANLPSNQPYIRGDANLDGVVDGSDFGLWNSSKFTATPAWCSGDFNADGNVDGSDFGVWNANKFRSADNSTLIPEPNAALAILVLVTMAVARNRYC
jgi:Lamin Tail Domain